MTYGDPPGSVVVRCSECGVGSYYGDRHAMTCSLSAVMPARPLCVTVGGTSAVNITGASRVVRNETGADIDERELAALMAVHPAPWMVMAHLSGRLALTDGNLREITLEPDRASVLLRGLAAAVNICACRRV